MATEASEKFQRHNRNIVITGHRRGRLPEDTEKIESILREVIRAFVDYGVNPGDGRQAEGMRVLTGNSDGTDAMVARLVKAGPANSDAVPPELHVVAVHKHRDSAEGHESFSKADREMLVYNTPDRDERTTLDADWQSAVDEMKVALADAVVIVWDGEGPQGGHETGGSVRLMREAIRHLTPVVWVHASNEDAVCVSRFDPRRFTEHKRLIFECDEHDVHRMKDLFVPLDPSKSTAEDIWQFVREAVAEPWSSMRLDEMKCLVDMPSKPSEAHGAGGHKLRRLSNIFRCQFYCFVLNFIACTALLGSQRKKQLRWSYADPAKPWRPNEFVDAHGLNERFRDAIWHWFDKLDRRALYASSRYRTNITLVSILPALAVVFAAAAALFPPVLMLGFELVSMAMVLLLVLRWDKIRVVGEGNMRTQDAWLNFRQAAEAIRTSYIHLSQMGIVRSLHRRVWNVAIESAEQEYTRVELAKPYHWLIIQIIRDAGIPFHEECQPLIISRRVDVSIEAIRKLVEDQCTFHGNQAARCEGTDKSLSLWKIFAVSILFVIVVVGILLALTGRDIQTIFDKHGFLLLLTTAIPAFAAAFDRVGEKMELDRTARSSKRMEQCLNEYLHALDDIKKNRAHEVSPGELAMRLRELSISLANAMYNEHDQWADLMQKPGMDISP